VYLIDTGFTRLAYSFSPDKGRTLENLVAIQLFKTEQKFYYFNEGKECDFVIKHPI
jgi:predicted AAA+ superfamily ATPase